MGSISKLDLTGSGIPDDIKDGNAITSISCNGIVQTKTNRAVDIDVESTLITDSTWTALTALFT